MRIHTETLTRTMLFEAAQNAGIRLYSVTEHGSRKRDHAFEVKATGSSSYRTNDGSEYAATWDEWGIFLRTLYTHDGGMIAGQYSDFNTFQGFTGNRFDTLTVADQHRRHSWDYVGTRGKTHVCQCGATLNNNALWV